MASKERFSRRQARPEKRKSGERTPKPNSFLIVSEGEKTEPMYFNGLADYINQKYGDSIDVEKPIIDAEGEGMSTVRLVREVDRIVARANILYSQVWVVFDKDEFKDFDKAIELAKEKGYHVGWSNQSFEYWIYLHFERSDSALHRDAWVEKLSEIYRKRGIDLQGYKKNNKQVFAQLTKHGSLRLAVKNAASIRKGYRSNLHPSQCDPCTTVDLLIKELEPYIPELL